MKLTIPAFIVLIIGLVSCSTPLKKSTLLYVGTYSENNSQGIYCFHFDGQTGSLTQAAVTPNQENPSFIALSPNGKNLYAVSEVKHSPNIDSGSVTAYQINSRGVLERINQMATEGYHPAHVAVSPDGHFVVASN
ncbi:MAG TPA: beta-propeller fold lactonase family protein, partial [Sunxiuqinia sp.]|nr:beta-propeller fold lactonase family protein [Sunxiuqinia sp.]